MTVAQDIGTRALAYMSSGQHEFEWKLTKHKLNSVSVKIEPVLREFASSEEIRPKARPTQPLHMTADELKRLRKLVAHQAPSTRTYDEVQSILYLIRGADLLVRLNDDEAMAVAAALRLHDYRTGAVIATERNAGDAFVLVVSGGLRVLVKDITVPGERGTFCDLSPGECVAEEHLRDNAGLYPSLVAADHSTILRVCKADFLSSHASWDLELQNRRLAMLRAVPCLVGFDPRLLRPLAERAIQERVLAECVLLKQGEPVQRVLIIASGECRVLKRTKQGLMLQTETLGPGAICGDVGALLEGGKHAASIVSSSNVTLLALQRSDLQYERADPEVVEVMRKYGGALAMGNAAEATLIRQLRLADHWSAFRRELATSFRAEGIGGSRSLAPPPRSTQRGLHAPAVELPSCRQLGREVRQEFVICPDGTPVSKLDAGDLEARSRRRLLECEARAKALASGEPAVSPGLADYLATRPGGVLWGGNGPLRAQVHEEERRQRARTRTRVRSLPHLAMVGAVGARRLWEADSAEGEEGATLWEPPSLLSGRSPRKHIREAPVNNQLRQSLPEMAPTLGVAGRSPRRARQGGGVRAAVAAAAGGAAGGAGAGGGDATAHVAAAAVSAAVGRSASLPMLPTRAGGAGVAPSFLDMATPSLSATARGSVPFATAVAGSGAPVMDVAIPIASGVSGTMGGKPSAAAVHWPSAMRVPAPQPRTPLGSCMTPPSMAYRNSAASSAAAVARSKAAAAVAQAAPLDFVGQIKGRGLK